MSSAAESSKDKGNAAFKASNLPLALAHYSTACQLDPSNHIYPLNRSLVHLKLEKWREAEKDASNALSLEPSQPTKALYRRALARRQLGKLVEAKKDLEDAKLAGAGEEVDKELLSLNKDLVESSPPLTPKEPAPSSTPTAPIEDPANLSTTPSNARLRAALSSSPSTVESPRSVKPTTPPARSSTNRGDLLTAVSTRTLERPQRNAPPSTSSASTSSASTPNTVLESTTAANVASSFADKKRERAGRLGPPSTLTMLPPTNPKPVTPTPMIEVEPSSFPLASTRAPLTAPISANASLPLAVPQQPVPASPTPSSSSLTSNSFEHTLSHLCSTPSQRLAFLHSIPLSSLRSLLKAGALTPDLMSLLISSLSSSAEEGIWTLQFLDALSRVDRFEMTVAFLSVEEREVLDDVFRKAEEGLKATRHRWGL